MRTFVSSPLDPRKLSMLTKDIAKQHPGRREAIHGRVHSMQCSCRKCRRAA